MANIRHYEIVLLIHPDHSDKIPEMIENYTKQFEAAEGKVHRFEDWGRLALAYPIQKVHKAHYLLFNVAYPAELILSLEHQFKVSELILRFLIIRRDEAIESPSAMLNPEEDQKSLGSGFDEL